MEVRARIDSFAYLGFDLSAHSRRRLMPVTQLTCVRGIKRECEGGRDGQTKRGEKKLGEIRMQSLRARSNTPAFFSHFSTCIVGNFAVYVVS